LVQFQGGVVEPVLDACPVLADILGGELHLGWAEKPMTENQMENDLNQVDQDRKDQLKKWVANFID
jgi:hypothetical protein